MSGDVITEGREAWGRLQVREHATWDDWLAVGRAITIGRTEAMKAANTNRAVGTRYNRAMRETSPRHLLIPSALPELAAGPGQPAAATEISSAIADIWAMVAPTSSRGTGFPS
jgi:hypothetical protein